MKALKLALFVLCLSAGAVMAQNKPSVDIVLSAITAQQGDTLTADVYIRNATTVGGVDVGITTDDTCLHVLDRQPGNFLPSSDEDGAFSPFSELTDHGTRYAVALTDRTRHASGDGLFYRVQLAVTCAQGTGTLSVSYAKVSSYADPNAEIIDLVSYSLDDGTLETNGTYVTIGSPGDNTAAATEEAATSTPAPDASVTPATGETQPESQSSPLIFVVLAVVVLASVVFIFFLVRRLWRSDDEE